MPEIADLPTLRDRLGHPASILCLGNGPSSEGPEIPEDCDRLFRVNWIWGARRFLLAPDVVFTGDPDAPPPDSRAVVGFADPGAARRILAGYAAPVDWFCVSSLLPGGLPAQDGLKPTNGALMVATAVALAPRRLVIAGIDLYRHAAGKYPGTREDDASDENDYDPIHSRDLDVSFLRAALARHRGERVILSAALREALSQGG
jgi:hypothetical protein